MKKLTISFFVLFAVALSAVAQSLNAAKHYLEQGNYVEAAKKLRPLADSGNAEAQYIAALLFFEGKGVNKDIKQSLKYASLSADQGYEDAINWIVFTYYAKDSIESLKYAEEYTEKYPQLKKEAIGLEIAERYILGKGTEKNEARGWQMMESHPLFEKVMEDDKWETSYWNFQMRSNNCRSLLELVEISYSSIYRSKFDRCLNYYLKNNPKSVIQQHSDNGVGTCTAILAYLSLQRDGFKNFKLVKELAEKAANQGSGMGNKLFSAYKNYPVYGDKIDKGIIYQIDYTKRKAMLYVEISCDYNKLSKEIQQINSKSRFAWVQISGEEYNNPFYWTVFNNTGANLLPYFYLWARDGIYKKNTLSYKVAEYAGQDYRDLPGKAYLIATYNF